MGHLKFNVLLTRVTATIFEFETPHALLRSRLAQHLERGSVTAGCLDELLEIASDAADDSAPGESSFADCIEAKLT